MNCGGVSRVLPNFDCFRTDPVYLCRVTEQRKAPAASVTTIPTLPIPALKSTAAPTSFLVHWQKPVLILFLALFAVNEALLVLRIEVTGFWRVLEAAFLLVTTFSALLSLAQRLPLQNVLTAGVMIYCLASLILAVAAISAIPFGPFVYGQALGWRFFDVVPWTMPLIWILLIVHGRGVARLIMRPWRKTNFYGFWVIGLTCLLVVLFDLAFEPFAVENRQYWLWRPTVTQLLWYEVPWVNFLGWFITALGIMCMVLPWLINKQPVKRPMDYHPLIVWLVLHVWVTTGNAMEGFWLACSVSAVTVVITTFLAIRGARW